MQVFVHHIYEYEKGVRNLVLHTTPKENTHQIILKLSKRNIDYFIDDVGNGNINVFFGCGECVDVIKSIDKKLNDYTPEEDFILGIMLGYDRRRQCERYLDFKEREGKLKIKKRA